MNEGRVLFYQKSLSNALNSDRQSILRKIETLGQELIGADLDKLYIELTNYLLNVPRFVGEPKLIKTEECNVNQNSRFRDHSAPKNGTAVTFSITFEGNHHFFDYHPNKAIEPAELPKVYYLSDQELQFRYELSPNRYDSEVLKKQVEENIKTIETYLDDINAEVNKWIDENKIPFIEKLKKRREKIIKDQEFIKTLPFQISKRPDGINYPSDAQRTPVQIKRLIPTLSSKNEIKEIKYFLENQTYEDILTTLQHMALVMERSPKLFFQLQEEDIRTLFLVHLNGVFQGQATGETFNKKGKTDILIKVDDHNIFIAECKFWEGKEELSKAIDQILKYLSWRDSKAALLIFNKNQNLTNVLKQIPVVLKNHPNFKNQIATNKETIFRFILSNKSDSEQNIILTILAFDIPRN